MKKIYSLLLLFTAISGFAQITYQPGYFINNQGVKTECLIKNVAWHENPVEFDYKLTKTADVQKAVIKDVKEFNVSGYKFVKYTVDIERSGSFMADMDGKKEPQWKSETLFLKVLVEGKANLYQYENNNLVKFFISTAPHETAQQLLYKQYIVNNKVEKNNQFRQQLFIKMKDLIANSKEFERLRYTKDDFVDLFLKYNNGTGEVKNLTEQQNKSTLNYKITVGAGLATVNYQSDILGPKREINYDLSNKPVYQAGIEIECILPFNNKKWSFFANPNVQFYKASDRVASIKYVTLVVHNGIDAKYNFAEIPFGIRHYMYVNANSKFFIDAAFTFAFKLGDAYVQYNDEEKTKIEKSSNIGAGAGFAYKRYSIAFKYNFSRGLNDHKVYSTYNYNSANIILAYRIL